MSANVVPTLYDLLIHPDLTPGDENGGFRGNVVIELDINEPTDVIVLHSHLLVIENVNFTAPDSGSSLVSVGKSFLRSFSLKNVKISRNLSSTMTWSS